MEISKKEGKTLFEIAISTTIIAIATLQCMNRNVKWWYINITAI